MIDLHCHIIPDVDDGPSHISQFLEMARIAVEQGVTHLFATPHHLNGSYENPKNKILQMTRQYSNYLIEEKIPLVLHPGQELRVHREIFQTIEADEMITLDNQGKYVLLELPSTNVPNYLHEVVYELRLRGITPIIPHPERNVKIVEEPELLYDLLSDGALTQLTAGSIIGQFGKKIKLFSEKLIEHQWTHFIASDAHNTHSRGFFLQQAFEAITKKFGVDAIFYYKENAELLLRGQNIVAEEAKPMRRKLFGFI
ncbi:tyrosine protein phosphatase [Robertmurraya siralis]|uniref:Tyrosine-protein phosphatase n=1 Tax=Robertmurraya siralis TaxID=77777 RepID=A0A919WHV7_9BACI|nr:CpsB/CapC family capsule biosynthesis tyrosine phosphatase [Robertmurraya siralis]GIN62009.1 tyrosine protein phosphatase [Robertmurraya siralis]